MCGDPLVYKVHLGHYADNTKDSPKLLLDNLTANGIFKSIGDNLAICILGGKISSTFPSAHILLWVEIRSKFKK